MKSVRPYAMRQRAESTLATRERIVRAAVDEAMAACTLDITLLAVARRADVSVQTVLRHFESRDGLLDVATDVGRRRVLAERTLPADDPAQALDVLMSHYELRGDFVIGVLADERRDPRALDLTRDGRALHRDWVSSTFAGPLAGLDGAAAEELVDLLVVATDVYTWKLLRRDRGLDPGQVVDRMTSMVDLLTARAQTR